MQNVKITETENLGSLWNKRKPEYIGECVLPSCLQKEIYDTYEYFTDKNGNLFCSKEHAEDFYGIKAANI